MKIKHDKGLEGFVCPMYMSQKWYIIIYNNWSHKTIKWYTHFTLLSIQGCHNQGANILSLLNINLKRNPPRYPQALNTESSIPIPAYFASLNHCHGLQSLPHSATQWLKTHAAHTPTPQHNQDTHVPDKTAWHWTGLPLQPPPQKIRLNFLYP